MEEKIKNSVIEEIKKCGSVSSRFEEKISVGEYLKDEIQKCSEIEITKDAIIDYLVKSGFEVTPDNFELAKVKLTEMEQDKLKETFYKLDNNVDFREYTTISRLPELNQNDLLSLQTTAMLANLNEIKNLLHRLENVIAPKGYSYEIATIKDRGGATNVSQLKDIVQAYADKGYRVVSVFTNELGINSHTTSNVTYNSTVDEVVVLFEKPIY